MLYRKSNYIYLPDTMEKNHQQLWDDCLQFIKDNIPAPQYESWFSQITSLGFEDKKLRLMLPSPFVVDVLEQRYMDVLGSAIRKVYGSGVTLTYFYHQVKNEPATTVGIRTSAPSPTIVAQSKTKPANPFKPQTLQPFDPQLNPRYTFENYCAGASNKIARAIGETVATNPSVKTFNPLFVFGSTGVVKTHLIQSIGVRLKETNPESRVLYVNARLFESQFTAAQSKGEINNFFHFYQSIDTLIIDDIQDLNGKPATQNTFFHIFNHLHQNNKQIIMSSDCAPAEMVGFEERMLSRFKWGMSVQLEKPDYELRRDVLRQKAEQDGVGLSDDVIDYIASNVTESIRDLEGVMVSLIGRATVLNCDITLDLAKRVISNSVKINRRQINFELILEHVCSYYNIDPDALFTKSRKREISDARQMLMYLAKKLTKMPFTAIGSRIGRNYATVIYSCKNIEERLGLEKQLLDDVNSIETALNSGVF